MQRKGASRMTEEKNNSEELNEETEEETEEEKNKKFDYEYVKELREEAKSYRLGKAKLKTEFAKVQEELKKIENEKLSDSEKKEKKIAELEKSLVDIQTEYKDKEIDNLILTVASGKNFADMEVVKLLAKKELDSEDDVDKKIVEKIIDKIAKDKPYLVSGKSTTSGSGNFPKKNLKGEKTDDEAFGDFLHDRIGE